MDNMKKPNLEFHKTCVLNYNNIEYFLHYWPLISCIKNILKISDLSQYFALNFKDSYINDQVI